MCYPNDHLRVIYIAFIDRGVSDGGAEAVLRRKSLSTKSESNSLIAWITLACVMSLTAMQLIALSKVSSPRRTSGEFPPSAQRTVPQQVYTQAM